MNNLPVELTLQTLSKLSFKDLTSQCQTNKVMKQICDENEDTLYTNLIKKDFNVKVNPKMLYILFNTLKDTVPFFDKTKHYDLLKNNIDNPTKFKYLLNYIDINSKSSDNETILMYALRYDSDEIINRILDLNADINAKNDKNWTPLMFALRFGTPDNINRILDLNPDIDTKTALEYALKFSTPEIVNRIKNMTFKNDLPPLINLF